MADLSFDYERYDGYFDSSGHYKSDPVGSDLRQYRATLSVGTRLARDWQLGAAVPWVWNDNRYSGISSQTQGVGDTSLSLWYEAFTERSAWRAGSARDLLPSVTVGPTLVIPTGISPYDDVTWSFDVTGRGFYRLDAALLVDKSYRAWSASLSGTYGWYRGRPVNRTNGNWDEPGRRTLGDRATASGSLSYRQFIGTGGNALTLGGAVAWVHEVQGTANGRPDTATGMARTSAGATLTWSSTDGDLSVRASWNHALQREGLGRNFPTTDIFSTGLRYVFR
jgi:hypothetical protein